MLLVFLGRRTAPDRGFGSHIVSPAERGVGSNAIIYRIRVGATELTPYPQHLLNVRGLGYRLKVDLLNGSSVHDT